MKQSQFFIIIILILLGVTGISSAQTAPKSDGCQQWNYGFGGGIFTTGTFPARTFSFPINVASADYVAGETVQLQWSTSEANTMTLTSPIINDVVNTPAATLATYTITIPSDGTYDFNFLVEFTYTGMISYSFFLSCTPIDASNMTTQTNSVETMPITSGCYFEDGRVNARDCDAPIVIYQTNMIVDLYAIDPSTSDGISILQIPIENLDPVEENTLLGETIYSETGSLVQLWQLTSGELQLQTTLLDGKSYVIIWSVDAPQDYIRRSD